METSRSAGRNLQCVVVTPEKALLDELADFVALPMFDGELGVLPGRRPMIGRLGIGELRVRHGSTIKSFLIHGGFAQIRGDAVTVLTPKAQSAVEMAAGSAEQALEVANAMAGRSQQEREAKSNAQNRARVQRKIIEKLSRPRIQLS